MTDPRDPNDNHEAMLRDRVRRALDSVHRPAPGLPRRAAEAAARDRQRRRRLPRPLAWAALAVVATAGGVLGLVEHQVDRGVHGPVVSPAPTLNARQLVYALTAANQVVAYDRATLHQRWRTQVAAPAAAAITPGTLLALSRDARVLYVLPLAGGSGGRSVELLDAASGRRQGSIALSGAGGPLYRTLAVDPRSGNLYAVGQDSGHVLVTVIDAAQRLVLATQVTRTLPAAAPPGPGFPDQAAVTADGARLYYSYTSPAADRAGIDWADISGARLVPCTSAAGAACLPGPGRGFVLAGDQVLFTDAAASPQLVSASRSGAITRRIATGLAGLVSDLVLDAAGLHAIAVGTCDGLGGLVSIELAGGTLRAVTTPAPAGEAPGSDTACGAATALLDASTVAVSRLTGQSAAPQSPGEIDAVDVNSGRITRTAALPAEVADLLALN